MPSLNKAGAAALSVAFSLVMMAMAIVPASHGTLASAMLV